MKPRNSTGNRRNPETHKAIIQAASQILQETGDLTFEEVARRSGAGKATIYRWWPQKIDLFMEVYYRQFQIEGEVPDMGDIRQEISCLISRTLKAWQNTASGKAFLHLIAKMSQEYPSIKEVRARFMPEQRKLFNLVLERGLQRGQLRNNLDLDVVADLVFGFTWHCLLSNQLNPEDPQLTKVIDIIYNGICRP